MIELTWTALYILVVSMYNWDVATPESTFSVSDLASMYCLSANVYHEARGEAFEDQIAVAHVVLNRVADSRWPYTVCEVITQRAQFSWYGDDFPDTIQDLVAFKKNVQNALFVYTGIVADLTDGATHYYAHDSIDPPYWADTLTVTLKLEGHTYLK
jgi:spore germination cell wall hydrolase CwlJ-like protein